MRDLNDFFFFAKVVEHGGFTAAARAVGIPKSKLSRRLAVLEGRLGVRLLQRSSRTFSVTEVGRDFYRQCMAMIEQAEAAEAVVSRLQSEPSGVIRLACPPGLLSWHLGESIAKFLERHRKVDMRVKAFNRRVDLIREGFDVALGVGPVIEHPSTISTRKVGEITYYLVASPSLLAGRRLHDGPHELATFPTINFWNYHSDHPSGDARWEVSDEAGKTAFVHHVPRLVTDDLPSMRVAAIAGLGVAQLPSLAVQADIEAGRLVRLMPRWRLPNRPVHSYVPSKKGMLPSVRTFLDFVASECMPYRNGTGAPREVHRELAD